MNWDSINGNMGNIQPFPGKIAVITNNLSVNEDDYHSADRLIAKYGDDKIIHAVLPQDFITDRYRIIEAVATLAADQDIKVMIINQAVEGSNAAVDKLKELRDDVFIIYCNTNEIPADSAARANLILSLNQPGMGTAMARQAKKQGAKVFVHYSYPRHMALGPLAARRDMIQKTCAAEGIQFVDAAAPDPTGEAGLAGARQFILEDVPKQVAMYGEDTAFFSTNCHMQASLIKAVVDCHAIFPQPCCPSPFHGFPEALGIKTADGQTDLNYVISEACRIAEEKNMTDRLSTWPVSASMMFTTAGAEYAISWIRNKVQKAGIDITVLEECMNAFIEEVIGEASIIYITSYSEMGKTYHNFKQVFMSYLDF